MKVIRLSALSDNYIFLLYAREQNIAAVIDPAQAEPVLKQLDCLSAELVAIFNTHHHYDHVGANLNLMQRNPEVKVYGCAEDRGRIPGQNVFLQSDDYIDFAGRTGKVIFVPGHTHAHIAYYFPPEGLEGTGELFCGDTLFAGGCGRIFEGTPRQMVDSLNKLAALPDNTRVWCAHEYTLKNLQFALTVDRDNSELQKRYIQVHNACKQGKGTIPSMLGVEKRTNPFLRYSQPALQLATQSQDAVQTFAYLRRMRDQF
ncbi:Hydroxyacylglutathione hydrolase [Richelia intracellularis HM01]|uniref:hydroxyacylglutathione hydrolase n=1 Tax=Richelia intracellularis TaxID=1164990 RepID=UPI0002B56196|nr:hydroxyacylglutathione hydrolase [Richelia intracellularis]CCH64533.1 Hydroxyacylglutathione hydrolase [Richelia intracellularis HM01]